MGNEPPRVALNGLTPLVYNELRSIAASLLKHERPDHTLQPTALVHEAYFRLARQNRADWRGRTHVVAVGALQMRRVLMDHAKQRNCERRGGGWTRVRLLGDATGDAHDVEVGALANALEALASVDPRRAQIVELRFFGGLTNEEVAAELGVCLSTVEKDWRFARAWLWRRLGADDDAGSA